MQPAATVCHSERTQRAYLWQAEHDQQKPELVPLAKKRLARIAKAVAASGVLVEEDKKTKQCDGHSRCCALLRPNPL